MTDIHAIIAAAKRVQQQQPFGEKDAALYIALGDARIAMAEALVGIAENDHTTSPSPVGAAHGAGINRGLKWNADIARECLEHIVKEANRVG